MRLRQPRRGAEAGAVPTDAAAEQYVTDLVRDEPVVLFALSGAVLLERAGCSRVGIGIAASIDSVAYQAGRLGGRVRAVLPTARVRRPSQIYIGGRHIGSCPPVRCVARRLDQRSCRSTASHTAPTSRSTRTRCCRWLQPRERVTAPRATGRAVIGIGDLAAQRRTRVDACRDWGFFQAVTGSTSARSWHSSARCAHSSRSRSTPSARSYARPRTLGILRPGAHAPHARLEGDLRLWSARRRGAGAAMAVRAAGVSRDDRAFTRPATCATAAARRRAEPRHAGDRARQRVSARHTV